MNKIDVFLDALIEFNEKTLNDNLSDEIVKLLWKSDDFDERVKLESVIIDDICVLLKCESDNKEIFNFRFEIEVALGGGIAMKCLNTLQIVLMRYLKNYRYIT